MAQSTLDDFAGALRVPQNDKCGKVKRQKATKRLQACGSLSLGAFAEAARRSDDSACVIVVTLSWRHVNEHCADRVIVANESSGAAFDLAPFKKCRKGEVQQHRASIGRNEVCGIVGESGSGSCGVGNTIADLLRESVHNFVAVTDGSAHGHIYARLAVGVALHFLKLRRCASVTCKRVAAPKDAGCVELLARVNRCRSVDAMRECACTYYDEHLAYLH